MASLNAVTGIGFAGAVVIAFELLDGVVADCCTPSLGAEATGCGFAGWGF
ncbi:MAG TPA: hypothetical protein P5307_29335 [Pirellulaceae bacterium]|nr:hypothetical protein [Pirellulaceae bacterium]